MNTRNSLLVTCLLAGLLIAGGLLFSPAGRIKAQDASSPHIVASYQHNRIDFKGFAANTELSFEIFSSPGGNLLHAGTVRTDSDGDAQYKAYDFFDIQVGQHIIANDGVTTKDLLVVHTRYDVLDADTDQARGIAPAGSQVVVYVYSLNAYHELATLTGQDGTWIADFGADGQDILAYDQTNAWIYDDNGDATEVWVPRLSVWNLSDSVSGESFTSGGTLTVEIYDAGGGTLLYSTSDITADSDHGGFKIPRGQHGQNLQAGSYVVVIDQTTGEERQLTVQPVTLDIFDYERELVEGTAPAGSTVSVRWDITLEVDESGRWSADFTTKGIDLNPSDDMNAMLFDLDGDSTGTGPINFMASSTAEFVHWGWHAAPVTVTLYAPNGDTVFGPQVFSEINSQEIWTRDYGIDLQPGYRIDIEYDDGRLIDLTLADLSVDDLDRDDDRAEGSAPPNTTVSVVVWDTNWPPFEGSAERARMDVPVDSSGRWQADFGTQGFDITEELNVYVSLQEIDGGVSLAEAPTNTSPVVELIVGPAAPVMVNTAVQVNASFSDPDADDTHTAVWDWGDGTTSGGIIEEENGGVSGSHTYTTAGVYTVKLTVTDNDGAWGQSIFRYVVVYDPKAGFVTGSGWINSPTGAYTPNPALTGKAIFVFVSTYLKRAKIPVGITGFQLRAANLNFSSAKYQWLVISGAKAQYKGSGKVNGSGDYGFLVTVVDGKSSGGGVDKFRIKIWDKATGVVIYDNQLGAPDDADATLAIGGGSIVIHK